MKRLLRNFLCGLIVLSFVLSNGQMFSLFGESKSIVENVQLVKYKGYTISDIYLKSDSRCVIQTNNLSGNHSNEWSFKPGGESAVNLYRESEGRVNLPSVPVFRLINILSKFQFITEMHKIDIDTFNSVACTGVVKENHSQRGFYIDLLCLLRI